MMLWILQPISNVSFTYVHTYSIYPYFICSYEIYKIAFFPEMIKCNNYPLLRYRSNHLRNQLRQMRHVKRKTTVKKVRCSYEFAWNQINSGLFTTGNIFLVFDEKKKKPEDSLLWQKRAAWHLRVSITLFSISCYWIQIFCFKLLCWHLLSHHVIKCRYSCFLFV